MQVTVDKLYKANHIGNFLIRISFSFFFFPLFYIMTIQDDDNTSGEAVYPVPPRLLAGGNCPTPHVVGMDQYKKMWEESVNDPDTFFSKASIYYFMILHGGSNNIHFSWHKTC